ncbi:Outer membrane protein assembly factor BamD [Aquisphaera giovannonii]|uniref:Outer membrane protein assembly factor BamD n=1 Tax=Aquisphaera giovannonii TaxID=406548 RepID=A0A5B9W1F2_9BACT|nr:tetratricopeptide repeat protein [Aquisphaera giovannonii]QEH34099.1 Outer membrane protein assembly factor BamD [Aquisphaera giovannonii]
MDLVPPRARGRRGRTDATPLRDGPSPRPRAVTPPAARLLRAARRLSLPAAALACGLFLPGCQGLDVPFAQWRAGRDKGLVRPLTDEEKAASASSKLEDPRTLLGRWLNPAGSNAPEESKATSTSPASRSGSSLILGSDGWRPMMRPKPNPEADKELQEALALFKQGKFPEAEAACKAVAKSRKGTHWGETAQFYLAESQYQQKKYVRANDSFERLIADYPGTEFRDKLVSREYALAQIWLAQSDPNAKPEAKLAWYTHFTGEQPLLDTRGTGLKALEHVRHHDPDGALADDAAFEIAEYHKKSGDYESAAIYYDQLVESHPKSPFVQKAQLEGIDVRLKGYLGPEYDGSGLVKARELVYQTTKTFPDRQASLDGLFHTLDLINDAEAEKCFNVGAYYKRAGYVPAAEFYFGKIPQRWPTSPWAVKAKTELAALAKMPRKPTVPSKIMSQPGANDPYFGGGAGGGAGGGMGGMGMGMPMPGGMG